MDIQEFLMRLEEKLNEGATGLLVEVSTDDGFSQLIGPYPLDTVDACVAIERLRAEEVADPEMPPNRYEVKYLFPTSSAEVPAPSS